MDDDQAGSAFRFNGNWREFAPIAFTNLLLIIVTLGIYRFWAKARERRYLWSRTDFIGDPLEWTGTGKELFIGFLLVMLLLGVPLFVIQFVVQGMAARGHLLAAFGLMLVAYVAILYLYGLARYRSLRYRLSRTSWHGIRGGSNDAGWGYALTSLWKTAIGGLIFGFLIPWSMTSLWNDRWGRLSFGNQDFAAHAHWKPIIGRFLLFYLLPIVGCVGGIAVVAGSVAGAGAPGPSALGGVIIGAMAVYLAMGVIAIVYYAAFLREAIGALTLNRIGFEFTARTIDWIKLLFGNIGLVIVTLGVGAIFLGYRNWSFFIRHLEAIGEVELAALTQSTTSQPSQGEGLLDAFDVGAF
ncbi:YjgN family protein [Rhizorhabdus sp.]|uniref:YjgN family protein n=1 Tax=Rhizorhabdus sp. TaxID=1968843 RepID=UPI001991F5A8|nr:YjgN family protein [Rhizorhabdus sp.]MBD3762488.1 DUF898 domain-containing protein [Rhizorhabdus sp.]